MASDLIIGPLDPETQKQVARICRHIGLKNWPRPHARSGWFSRFMAKSAPEPAGKDTMISVLRVSAIDFFIHYAAGLEGLSEADAMQKTAFRNLPWWLLSVWLPIAFDSPRELAPVQDEPMFVGSSVRLLSELATIKDMSTMDVAATPRGYADMRNDYRTWFRATDNDPLSDDDVIRWLWTAFREGAEISIANQVPMILAP